MTSRFKQTIWMVPLVIAGLVALFGWWGNRELRRTIEQQLRTQLTSTLNANVTSLEIWTTNQTRLATELAGEPDVRTRALRILERSVRGRNPFESDTNVLDLDQLNRYLRPRLSQLGYETAQLVNTNFAIVAGSMRARPGPALQVAEAHTNKFAELFSSGEPVIITPFKPELLAERRAAGFCRQPGNQCRFARANRPFQTNATRGRRGNASLMQVAAPLAENGVVRGALALIINPDQGIHQNSFGRPVRRVGRNLCVRSDRPADFPEPFR